MKVRVSKNVVFRALGDEAVMLDLATGVYFGLDDVGTRMWQTLAERGSTQAAATVLQQEFAVERPELLRDLEDLVHQLADKGLVTIEAEDSSQGSGS